ncbi:MAG: undecaprenyl-diphosphate phosphatase [Candidatus Babeliales bacterium]
MGYLFLIIFFSIVLEMFPISSSGNLYLIIRFFTHYLLLDNSVVKYIEYACHIPVCIIVAIYFFKSWIRYLLLFPRSLFMIGKIFCYGFVVESIMVLFFVFFQNKPWLSSFLPIGFLITSGLLLSLRWCASGCKKSWNLKSALLLGIAQGLALLPSISRFGITFVVARWQGFSAQRSFELSWLIAWPIQLVGGLFGLIQLYRFSGIHVLNQVNGMSMLIASSIAYLGLYFVHWCITTNRLWYFAYYTMILVLVTLLI